SRKSHEIQALRDQKSRKSQNPYHRGSDSVPRAGNCHNQDSQDFRIYRILISRSLDFSTFYNESTHVVTG
ncbi:MAG: hypothetical protein WCR52_15805, partial [Bacteroidota bacterium]